MKVSEITTVQVRPVHSYCKGSFQWPLRWKYLLKYGAVNFFTLGESILMPHVHVHVWCIKYK